GNLALSVAIMFVAGFLATLLKNLGDRASGLAISVYLLFIICNAYPTRDVAEVKHRVLLIAIGAGWPLLVGVFTSLLMPVQQPFRRQIALIWRSIATLAETIAHNAGNIKANDEVFKKEKLVREAIDKSFEFYGKMAHQANVADTHQFQLLLLRKNAALVTVNLVSIAEELEHINIQGLDAALRVKAATMFNALREALSRIAVFVLTLKGEEQLIAVAQIKRVKKLLELLREYPIEKGTRQTLAIQRIVLLTGRTLKLLESAIERTEQLNNDVPVFRSYSMMKTLFVLQPKKIAGNVRTLVNFNSMSIRFALRSAIAAALGLYLGYFLKNFHTSWWPGVGHGYWVPFSIMIVIQPYFGATLKKAIDRVVGTILGGVAGGLLALLPTGLHLKEAMLFVSFVYMVYYVRKNYAIAAFIVTLNLVLLFSLEQSYDLQVLLERALCTVLGCLMAVVAGFALLPTWDKKWLPRYLAEAITTTYDYF
ncbi:MAG: FUSC family protein, partial [Chitinophagia bacterium]|nr:FUSC family protein [Chitinophagia bacterium]